MVYLDLTLLKHKSQTSDVKANATKQATFTAPPTPDQIVVAMRRAVQRVRRMTHAERVQSLKEAGILTNAGKLSAGYR
jgi:hypothetical protein